MTSGTRKSYQAAVDRARALGGARKARDLGNGRYLVTGRRGDEYRVAVDLHGDYACTCPAGQQGNPCWHQAAAWLKRLGLPKVDPRDSATAPLAERSGLGIGMSRRWADDDDTSPLDLFQRATA
jgi:hypothetical protein